jgi:ABC-type antimicrobial peptide transport system permease subunit
VAPFIVLRTAGGPALVASAVRREVRDVDPLIPIYDLRAMTTIRADAVSERRFALILVGIFGIVALTLAAIGVYGVMALSVAERRTEMGVRLALGATPAAVLRLMLRQAVLLSLAGLGIGLAAALALMPLMAHYLFGVAARDILTLAATTILLLGVSTLAAFAPARKAMRIDPIAALKE